MQVTVVNNMQKYLDKLKSAMPVFNSYNEGLFKETDHPLMDELKTRINEVEDLLLELKLNHNSSAAKISWWFKHELTKKNGNLSSATRIISCTESYFTLIVDSAKLFNLDLSYNGDENDQEYYKTNIWDAKDLFWYKGNPAWVNSLKYSDLITISEPVKYNNSITLQFSYSKKLTKDTVILDQVLSEITQAFWDHTRRLAKP